jgi:hypothetical protein
MANYLERVAAAGARVGPQALPAVAAPPRLPSHPLTSLASEPGESFSGEGFVLTPAAAPQRAIPAVPASVNCPASPDQPSADVTIAKQHSPEAACQVHRSPDSPAPPLSEDTLDSASEWSPEPESATNPAPPIEPAHLSARFSAEIPDPPDMAGRGQLIVAQPNPSVTKNVLGPPVAPSEGNSSATSFRAAKPLSDTEPRTTSVSQFMAPNLGPGVQQILPSGLARIQLTTTATAAPPSERAPEGSTSHRQPAVAPHSPTPGNILARLLQEPPTVTVIAPRPCRSSTKQAHRLEVAPSEMDYSGRPRGTAGSLSNTESSATLVSQSASPHLAPGPQQIPPSMSAQVKPALMAAAAPPSLSELTREGSRSRQQPAVNPPDTSILERPPQVRERQHGSRPDANPPNPIALPRLKQVDRSAPLPLPASATGRKNATRIAIGRIEVQVNNHPQSVAVPRPVGRFAPQEINLEGRFLTRFVIRPR